MSRCLPLRGVGLMRRTPLTRGMSDKPLEYGGEVSLRLEAHIQGDLDDRDRAVLQQFLGAPDASPQQEFVRPKACCRPELGGEMHPAKARHCGQIRQADLVREVIVDIVDDTLEPPLLKRPDFPAARRELDLRAGCWNIRLEAGQSDGNSEPQGFGAIPILSLLRSF